MLSEKKWLEERVNPKEYWRGIDVELSPDEQRAISIFQFRGRKDGLVGIIHISEWLAGKYKKPVKHTNYHIKRTPIDFQVEKKVNFDDEEEDKSDELSLEYLEKKLAEIDKLIEADKFEKEMGLQFFSRLDAKDLIELLERIKQERLRKSRPKS